MRTFQSRSSSEDLENEEKNGKDPKYIEKYFVTNKVCSLMGSKIE